MENSKKINTTYALIITMMVVVSLASSALAVSDAIEVHRNRKLAQLMEVALLIGHPGENCISKGQPCGLFDPCCDHLYCTDQIQGTCICVPQGQACGLYHKCCEGLSCTGPFSGTCIKVTEWSPEKRESSFAEV